jgi:hypothetical protein
VHSSVDLPGETILSEPAATPRLIARERILVAVGSVVLFWSIFFRGSTFIYLFDQNEGGIWLDEGARVVAGDVMYRDFSEHLFPGVVYFDAAAIRLFGDRIVPLAIVWIGVGIALTLLVHSLATLSGLDRLNRISAVLIFATLIFIPYSFGNHKWLALLLGMSAIAIVLRFPLSTLTYAFAGALLGASILCTQDFGGATAMGLLAGMFLVRRQLHRGALLITATACLVVTAAVMAWFASKVGTYRLIDECFLFLFTRYRAYADAVIALNLSNTSRLPRTIAELTLAVAGAIAGSIAVLQSRSDSRNWRLIPIATAGIALLFITAIGRPIEPRGVAVRSTLLIVPLLVGLNRMQSRLFRWTIAIILALGVVHSSVAMAVWRQFFEPMKLESHRAGTVWVIQPMPELEWVERNSVRGEPVALFPSKGGFYFLSQTTNASRFDILATHGFTSLNEQNEILASIDANKPRIAVWDDIQLFDDRRPEQSLRTSTLEPLYQGLLRRYQVEARLPTGCLLLRQGPAHRQP